VNGQETDPPNHPFGRKNIEIVYLFVVGASVVVFGRCV
jgi:hypothetical protein